MMSKFALLGSVILDGAFIVFNTKHWLCEKNRLVTYLLIRIRFRHEKALFMKSQPSLKTPPLLRILFILGSGYIKDGI